jgi:hypothetical protein
MYDENNGFQFGWLDLLAPWLQILLITLKYSALAGLHTFQFTVAHALGFQVFTSRLLATDLNTENSTSNHYEVFLLFRLQSLWNLGIKNSSGLTPPAYNRLVTAWTELASAFTYLISTLHRHHEKHRLYCWWRHRLRGGVFIEPFLKNGLHNPAVLQLLGADDMENLASSIVVWPSNELLTNNLSSREPVYQHIA